MRRIVDVFVRDTLRASYPIVIEGEGRRPSKGEFISYVRKRLNRSVYSAQDIKAAKFVVREAGANPAARR